MNLDDIMLSEIGQSQKDKYHMIPLIWVTTVVTVIGTESRSGCQELGRGENGDLLFNEYKVSVAKMKKFWRRIGSGDGCTMM